MNGQRARVASRGANRSKPQTPEVAKTRLPMIGNTSDDYMPSIWSPAKPTPGYAVGVCSQQGKRPYQEDQHAVRQFLNNVCMPGKTASETHFFGLFDGHAGGRCSTHLSSNLANCLVEEDCFTTNLPLALKRSFYTVNEQFLKIAEKNRWHDGSTGNVAVIRDGKLTVANVGDCRALLISNGRPLQMSNDHKPTNPEEQKRIASLGGSVVYCMGVARVNKVLAVSRAFGNRTLRQVIRPDAELMQRELAPGDDFLVMASDGLWDVLRNKDVADVCYSAHLQRRPQAIADELVNMALARGSMDNVTCICVNLGDYRGENSAMDVDSNRRSASMMDISNTSNLSRSGNYGFEMGGLDANESIIGQNDDNSDDNDNDELQYSAKLRPKGNNNNNNNNNNNAAGHDIPSKQRSLGAINPRDLPSMGGDYDPFGLKVARSSFVKAVSTNSISSSENHEGGSTSFGYLNGNVTANNTYANSMSSVQSEKNPGNGFLRPLTALDATIPPSSSSGFRNRGAISNNTTTTMNINNSSNNNNSSTFSDLSATTPLGIASHSKLSQIRSMKANSGLSNSNSNEALVPTNSRLGFNNRPNTMQSMIPRPNAQQYGYNNHHNNSHSHSSQDPNHMSF